MTTPELQPAESPEPPRFQYTLRTLLLLFVVLGSSMAVFGAWGIVVFVVVVGLAVYLHHIKSFSLLSFHLLLVCNLFLLIAVLVIVNDNFRNGRLNWANLAALAVSLLSIGALLVAAVRNRVWKRASIVRTWPSKIAVGAAYACELLLVFARFFLPCTCGHLARWCSG